MLIIENKKVGKRMCSAIPPVKFNYFKELNNMFAYNAKEKRITFK